MAQRPSSPCGVFGSFLMVFVNIPKMWEFFLIAWDVKSQGLARRSPTFPCGSDGGVLNHILSEVMLI